MKKTKSMKIWLHGSSGRMGQELKNLIRTKQEEFVYFGGSDLKFEDFKSLDGQKVTKEKLCGPLKEADLVLDFSTVEGNKLLWSALSEKGLKEKAILIGTTNLKEETIKEWRGLAEKNQHKILIVPNTSLGIFLLTKTAAHFFKLLSEAGFDTEILETHHRNKVDAPSGTAKFIANTLATQKKGTVVITDRKSKRKDNEITVQALRGGSVFGEHEVRFLGDDEELVISHRALSRRLFAKGSLELGKWLLKQEKGFYKLDEVDL